MPALPIADKLTLDQVKALIGASGDPAGILTLFAHMAELEARLTATRAGYLDKLSGAAIGTDPGVGLGSNSSVMAMLRYAVDWITNVGGWTDELESRLTATRAAKLDYLDRLGGGTINIFRQTVSINNSPTTILSVAGSGILWSYFQRLTAGSFLINNMTITIDGVQKYNRDPNYIATPEMAEPIIMGPIKFNTSLLITATLNTAGPIGMQSEITYQTGV